MHSLSRDGKHQSGADQMMIGPPERQLPKVPRLRRGKGLAAQRAKNQRVPRRMLQRPQTSHGLDHLPAQNHPQMIHGLHHRHGRPLALDVV